MCALCDREFVKRANVCLVCQGVCKTGEYVPCVLGSLSNERMCALCVKGFIQRANVTSRTSESKAP